jgi:hypothetical protein
MSTRDFIKNYFDEELGKLFDEMYDKMSALADTAYRHMDAIGERETGYHDLEEVAKKRCVEFIVNRVL